MYRRRREYHDDVERIQCVGEPARGSGCGDASRTGDGDLSYVYGNSRDPCRNPHAACPVFHQLKDHGEGKSGDQRYELRSACVTAKCKKCSVLPELDFSSVDLLYRHHRRFVLVFRNGAGLFAPGNGL